MHVQQERLPCSAGVWPSAVCRQADTEGRCWPSPCNTPGVWLCSVPARRDGDVRRAAARSQSLTAREDSHEKNTWSSSAMYHARSGVERVRLSRDEPPTSGAERSRRGHEGSLDPDCDHPHHGAHYRGIAAGPGPWGTPLSRPSSSVLKSSEVSRVTCGGKICAKILKASA